MTTLSEINDLQKQIRQKEDELFQLKDKLGKVMSDYAIELMASSVNFHMGDFITPVSTKRGLVRSDIQNWKVIKGRPNFKKMDVYQIVQAQVRCSLLSVDRCNPELFIYLARYTRKGTPYQSGGMTIIHLLCKEGGIHDHV